MALRIRSATLLRPAAAFFAMDMGDLPEFPIMKEVIGNCRLYRGDCLKVMPKISRKVDLVLTDLPYGTTACKWDQIIPFADMWREVDRIAKDNAAKIFTASMPFTAMLVASNIKNFKHEWIWRKNKLSNFATVKYQPGKEHESVLVFANKTPSYFPLKQERAESGKARIAYKINACNTGKREAYSGLKGIDQSLVSSLRVPSSVQNFNVERGLHPTQKPVALMEYMIRTYTKPGDTVLDFCMGSGTTGIACINTARNFIGIEKDAAIFEAAQNRIQDHHSNMELIGIKS